MGDEIDFVEEGAGETFRLFRVKGDAMVPSYPPGSRALVNATQRSFSGDGVYIIEERGCLVLTRLQGLLGLGSPRVRIRPDNSLYPVEDASLDDLFIHGRVVGFVCRGGVALKPVSVS